MQTFPSDNSEKWQINSTCNFMLLMYAFEYLAWLFIFEWLFHGNLILLIYVFEYLVWLFIFEWVFHG